MWKPGQLITICGEVYRVKRCERSYNICKDCAFDDDPNCDLRLYEPKYRSCTHLIPDDCYFVRAYPKS